MSKEYQFSIEVTVDECYDREKKDIIDKFAELSMYVDMLKNGDQMSNKELEKFFTHSIIFMGRVEKFKEISSIKKEFMNEGSKEE